VGLLLEDYNPKLLLWLPYCNNFLWISGIIRTDKGIDFVVGNGEFAVNRYLFIKL